MNDGARGAANHQQAGASTLAAGKGSDQRLREFVVKLVKIHGQQKTGARRTVPLEVSIFCRCVTPTQSYVSFFKNGVKRSMGTGKIVVEFFSEAISTRLCK